MEEQPLNNYGLSPSPNPNVTEQVESPKVTGRLGESILRGLFFHIDPSFWGPLLNAYIQPSGSLSRGGGGQYKFDRLPPGSS